MSAAGRPQEPFWSRGFHFFVAATALRLSSRAFIETLSSLIPGATGSDRVFPRLDAEVQRKPGGGGGRALNQASMMNDASRPVDGNAVMTEESADSFPVVADFTVVPGTSMNLNRIPRGAPGPLSVQSHATNTTVASEFGLSVGEHKDAFLKSITFLKDKPDMDWGIRFADPVAGRRKQKLSIESVEGSLALSPIEPGDILKSINQKRCGPSFNAERALEYMKQCLENEKMLSIAVENKNGSDILVQATVIKPSPKMTYEQLGMVVWFWGYLCIKSIDKESIFKHTVLKSSDNIVAINDIPCNDVTPEQFAGIIAALPLEVTITVKRRKQRFTGRFG